MGARGGGHIPCSLAPDKEDSHMTYHNGDYVYPVDLPRRLLCRVRQAESLGARSVRSQILKLEPLEGPWPAGTELVRLDEWVAPAEPRRLWRGASRPARVGRPSPKRKTNSQDAA